MMKINVYYVLAVVLVALNPALSCPTVAAPTTGLKRFVSANPSFVLFKPDDWKVRNEEANDTLRISVSNPEGTSRVENLFADNPQGKDNSLTLLVSKAKEIKSYYPDLLISDVQVCKDREVSCAAATLSYTVQGTSIKGRFYFHAGPKLTTIRSYSAPASRLEAQRAMLLDILTNLHVRGGPAPVSTTLVNRRAADGSLSLSLPEDWTFLAQRGTAMAVAPGGGAGFIFTAFQVMPSNYGVVPPPNVIVSGYQRPADFVPKVFAKFGNRDIRVLGSMPDSATVADCPRRIGKMCDAADVQLSWVSPKGTACIGSFKVLNARPGVTRQWFSIVAGMWGPGNGLAQYMPILEQVGASFKINDAYAAGYIRNGLAHLRALQQKTAQAMQGLYDAIHANQSDYESRVARKEASDAKADDYRRGNSYWISDLEGGKVYATDPWGTKDTRTGEWYDGASHGYIHFEGQNPAHQSENMREVSSYDLKQMGYK
jgi:hypothetical protein